MATFQKQANPSLQNFTVDSFLEFEATEKPHGYRNLEGSALVWLGTCSSSLGASWKVSAMEVLRCSTQRVNSFRKKPHFWAQEHDLEHGEEGSGEGPVVSEDLRVARLPSKLQLQCGTTESTSSCLSTSFPSSSKYGAASMLTTTPAKSCRRDKRQKDQNLGSASACAPGREAPGSARAQLSADCSRRRNIPRLASKHFTSSCRGAWPTATLNLKESAAAPSLLPARAPCSLSLSLSVC